MQLYIMRLILNKSITRVFLLRRIVIFRKITSDVDEEETYLSRDIVPN